MRRESLPAGLNRREFLSRMGGGFGALALADLLNRDRLLGASSTTGPGPTPLAAHPAKAKSVIFVFLQGGPSHLDLFDPKPTLNALAGQRIPPSFKRVITAMGEFDSPLLASKRRFRRCGQSGAWISDWLPHTRRIVDELAIIRSCWADGLNHVGSVCQMNTGSVLAGRPSLGSWVSYGLGSENQNLPSFMVMLDRKATVHGGPRNWGAGFMPATYQGTQLHTEGDPIRNLTSPSGSGSTIQKNKLNLLNQLNRRFLEGREHQSELEARIASYELAFRMQAAAPEAADLKSEPQHTLDAYGLGKKPTHAMARCCLLARRMVERGVRFVQIYSGAGNRWDSHSKIEANHSQLCAESDQPIAALISDLKQRGLLDQTLVLWGGEFGRTPQSEKGDGRDHNPSGFTMWMAGGGIRAGHTIGATDELGLHAVQDRAHVHDLHATILHLMGLDPMGLTYLHNGRPENLVINDGAVIKKLLA